MNSFLCRPRASLFFGLVILGIANYGVNSVKAQENKKIVVWDKIILAYDAFLDYPSPENAKALAATLPKDKPDKMIGDWGKALKHIFSPDNYPTLDMEVLAGDRWATAVTFRLLNVTDGHYTEITESTLGYLVRINPRLFLETLYEYASLPLFGDMGYPVAMLGEGYGDRKKARKYAYEMRIKALESVKDEKYKEIRDACIYQLREAIEGRFK